MQDKVLTPDQLQHKLPVWRFKGHKIVFTNGCFALIRRGHVHYLAQARDLGDVLVVGLNTDDSVKRLGKSDSRPLQAEGTRAEVLAALHCVDAIALFDGDTPIELIQQVQPDVLVKGGDYTVETIVGHDVVAAKGGETIVLDFLPGYSTTAIENKIREAE